MTLVKKLTRARKRLGPDAISEKPELYYGTMLDILERESERNVLVKLAMEGGVNIERLTIDYFKGQNRYCHAMPTYLRANDRYFGKLLEGVVGDLNTNNVSNLAANPAGFGVAGAVVGTAIAASTSEEDSDHKVSRRKMIVSCLSGLFGGALVGMFPTILRTLEDTGTLYAAESVQSTIDYVHSYQERQQARLETHKATQDYQTTRRDALRTLLFLPRS